MPKKDNINHPSHYTKGEFETIDVIEDITQFYPAPYAYGVGSLLGYVGRAPHKGEMLKDLKKAQWHLNRLVTQVEENGDLL